MTKMIIYKHFYKHFKKMFKIKLFFKNHNILQRIKLQKKIKNIYVFFLQTFFKRMAFKYFIIAFI